MKTQQNFDFSNLHKSTENMTPIENKESGSKNKYDFDAWRNTGTLIGALDYMLQVIYSGEYASEIWHFFRMSDKYQPSYRFSWQALVRGGKAVSGHVLTEEEQIQATICADKDNVMLNCVLQLHHIGKSNLHIRGTLIYFYYYPSEEIIEELITISEKRPIRHEFCEEKQEWQEYPLPNDAFGGVTDYTQTFLRGLVPMLQNFIYFGESTEETRLVFLNLKRRFFASLIKHYSMQVREEMIPVIICYMARGIVALKFILQSHHMGKDAQFICLNITMHNYYFSEDFIQEIIDSLKKPDEGDPMRHKLREDSPENKSG